jgi:hypothetical protein
LLLDASKPRPGVVGIVSHADVLKVFLRPDSDIRRDVLDEVIFSGLVPVPERIQVKVRDGVVLLEGLAGGEASFPSWAGLRPVSKEVVRVENRLGSDLDDRSSLPSTLSRPLP